MKGHHWYRVGDMLVACPLKCGSTAFRDVVSGGASLNVIKTQHGFNRYMGAKRAGPWTPKQAARYAEAHGITQMLLAVRHPVERFASLWRSLKGIARKGKSTTLTTQYGLVDPTADKLMSVIERLPDDNHHWHRQVDYIPPGGGVELVPYRELLGRLGFDRNPTWNESPKDIEGPLPRDRIRRHFAGDFELWALLHEGTGFSRRLLEHQLTVERGADHE